MEKYQALLLLGMWIIPHLLLFNLVRVPTSNLTLILCITLLTGVYLLKPATSDLSRYSVYFNSGFLTNKPYTVNADGDVLVDPVHTTGEPFLQSFDHDPGFGVFARLLNQSGFQRPFLPRFTVFKKRYIADGPVLVIMLVGLACLAFSCSRTVIIKRSDASDPSPPESLYWVPVILGSLFFMLGSQNVLRQFLGLIFVIVAICVLFERRFLWSLIATTLALSLHHWSIGFMAIFVVLMLAQSIFHRFLGSNSVLPNVFGYAMSGFAIGCIGIFVIKLLLMGALDKVSPYVTHTISAYSEINQYARMDFSSLSNRAGGFIKLMLIGCTIIISEIILSTNSLSVRWDVRSYRLGFFGFMVPFGIYPEILSRMMLFYFAIELLYVCGAIVARERRVRVAGAVVFAGYSVAPNGVNILLGHEWLAQLTW